MIRNGSPKYRKDPQKGSGEKMFINDQLKKVTEKYGIARTDQILYGTNIPMPKAVLPTPWKTYLRFDQTEFYFFYFDERGFSLFTRDGEGSAFLSWSDITDFKVSYIGMIGKMTVKTADSTYKFQLNRFVFGCPWIGVNTRLLKSKGFFYPRHSENAAR